MVINPASMLSESICVMSSGSSWVLAMFSLILRRESSDALTADPTTMCTFATSCRSVFAVMPSQKTLMPPATTGMLAVRVVFICHGASPLLGTSSSRLASRSSALTTKFTKTTLSRALEPAPKKSMPRGMLKETNWSGRDAGLAHMEALGPHSWRSVWLKSSTRGKEPPVHSKHLCVNAAVSKKTPFPARTESRGIRPAFSLTPYFFPRVKVTWT
eukprot:3936716-Rhodomonas_salina.2